MNYILIYTHFASSNWFLYLVLPYLAYLYQLVQRKEALCFDVVVLRVQQF